MLIFVQINMNMLKFYKCEQIFRIYALKCIVSQLETNYYRTTGINFLSIVFIVFELCLQYRKMRFHSNARMCPHFDQIIQIY